LGCARRQCRRAPETAPACAGAATCHLALPSAGSSHFCPSKRPQARSRVNFRQATSDETARRCIHSQADLLSSAGLVPFFSEVVDDRRADIVQRVGESKQLKLEIALSPGRRRRFGRSRGVRRSCGRRRGSHIAQRTRQVSEDNQRITEAPTQVRVIFITRRSQPAIIGGRS
jgi:hypothetical protein